MYKDVLYTNNNINEIIELTKNKKKIEIAFINLELNNFILFLENLDKDIIKLDLSRCSVNKCQKVHFKHIYFPELKEIELPDACPTLLQYIFMNLNNNIEKLTFYYSTFLNCSPIDLRFKFEQLTKLKVLHIHYSDFIYVKDLLKNLDYLRIYDVPSYIRSKLKSEFPNLKIF